MNLPRHVLSFVAKTPSPPNPPLEGEGFFLVPPEKSACFKQILPIRVDENSLKQASFQYLARTSPPLQGEGWVGMVLLRRYRSSLKKPKKHSPIRESLDVTLDHFPTDLLSISKIQIAHGTRMRTEVSLLFLLSLMLPSHSQAADSLRHQLSEMRQLDDQIINPHEKAPLLEQALATMLASTSTKTLDQVSDEELRDLYDAATLAAFYSRSPSSVSAMERTLRELERRKEAPAGSADDMVANFVAARMFDQANAYYRTHGDEVTRTPPSFEDINNAGTQPTYLDISSDGSTLRRRALGRTSGPLVVVIGSPGCHFSRNATQAIEEDAPLSALLQKHAVWMIPQQIIRDITSIARWNRDHPVASMGLIYRQQEWPFVTDTATPAFYFLRHGKLVTSFSGWPGTEQKRRLLLALREIGIDTAAAEKAR